MSSYTSIARELESACDSFQDWIFDVYTSVISYEISLRELDLEPDFEAEGFGHHWHEVFKNAPLEKLNMLGYKRILAYLEKEAASLIDALIEEEAMREELE